MADMDTIHRVVEKLEFTGGEEASAGIRSAANAADKAAGEFGQMHDEVVGVAHVLDDAETQAKKTGGVLKDSGDGSAGAWGSVKDKFGEVLGQMTLANLAAEALQRAFDFIVQAVGDLARKLWEVNTAFESAQSRTLGLTMASMKLPEGAEGFETALAASNATMAEFKEMAFTTASSISEMEGAYARVQPVLAGMGKNQSTILDITEKAAAAAKVYGAEVEQSGGIVAKGILEGVVEGETAFARAFKGAIGAMPGQGFNKLPVEERLEKINQVLDEMSAPIDKVTDDTQGALARWRILSEDVLQRITYPIYVKIGDVVGNIVGWLESNEDVIDAIASKTAHWFGIIWETGSTIWDIVASWMEWSGFIDTTMAKFEVLVGVLDGIMAAVDFIVHSWKTIKEFVSYLIDPSQGIGKLNALAEGLKFKFLDIIRIIKDIGISLLKAMGGEKALEWAEKLPGIGDDIKEYATGLKTANEYFDSTLDQEERRVAELEKRHGLAASTEVGKRMEAEAAGIGMDTAKRDELFKSLFGKNRPLINVEEMNIQQDFSSADPDAVMVEMVRSFESLADEAISSNVGNEATTFAGGG